jgi:AcrR family transcriptional regulator
MPPTTLVRNAEATRDRILRAAFLEFYRNGFQGGSLSRIVDAAGVTKGALFHHFPGKEALGYAVADELIAPLLVQRWLEPLEGARDPIGALQQTFRRFIREDIDSGHWAYGCPLNNLAQEMSPLDEGFRSRVDAMYDRWRASIAAALRAGAAAGSVRADVPPDDAAALVVAAQMGIWGTGKSSQDERLMVQAGQAICSYLETLRA